MAEDPAAANRTRLAEPLLFLSAGAVAPAYAMRDVEFNPVRAEMVESVLNYPWSSAQAHAGLDDFVAEREAKLDRNLFPRKPGPKPKVASPTVRSGARMEIGG